MLTGIHLFCSGFPPFSFTGNKYFEWDQVVLSKLRVSIIKVEQ